MMIDDVGVRRVDLHSTIPIHRNLLSHDNMQGSNSSNSSNTHILTRKSGGCSAYPHHIFYPLL